MLRKSCCCLAIYLLNCVMPVWGENASKEVTSTETVFKPFTGKVAGDRVRVRLQPNLQGHIIREMDEGDLVLIVGEAEDYYKVRPPAGTKAYIYRTYVLDDVVEGMRVNVRLFPNIDAPVIDQLNTGDPAKGVISADDKKWLEIPAPSSTVFYVAKDYILQAGDETYITEYEKRRKDVQHLLNSAYLLGQAELRKPFEEVQIQRVKDKFEEIIANYTEFPRQVEQAKEGLEQIEDAFLQKKVAFLETKTTYFVGEAASQGENQVEVLQVASSRIPEPSAQEETELKPMVSATTTDKMLIWDSYELASFHDWARRQTYTPTLEEYYQQQKTQAVKVKGFIEPYSQAVKNKPGDYILRDANYLPIAYIYSTQINLQDTVGQEVTLLVSPRPNNNFAFPAYFVHSIE